jgi:signal transduction histidine kinase
MKLFSRYSRINVLATIIIFLIASVAFYFTLHLVLINQIDEDLKIEEREINSYIAEHDQLPESISVKDQLIHYATSDGSTKRHFATTYLIDSDNNEKEKFRQLVFEIKAKGKWYQVTVSKSLEETETLGQSILAIAFITILAILLVAFFINRVVLKRIWKPFYQSLDSVKYFKVGSNDTPHFSNSNIDEFQLMNQTIENITSQARLDYLSLKTFSENASHEIQTPLAVIRSKLDLMIQEENLTEKQYEALQTAYDSIQKLTKLNQSLLLLAKIENNQYQEIKKLDLKKLVEEKIAAFQELWSVSQLTVTYELQAAIVLMNEELADILLNNLLSNATRHNYKGGRIEITLRDNELIIANTSKGDELISSNLYQRFTRTTHGSESNGLGLSIVKQICDRSSFRIQYSFAGNRHVFTIFLK